MHIIHAWTNKVSLITPGCQGEHDLISALAPSTFGHEFQVVPSRLRSVLLFLSPASDLFLTRRILQFYRFI